MALASLMVALVVAQPLGPEETQLVPYASELPPGSVAWREVSVPLTEEAPLGRLWAFVLGSTARAPGRILPFAEVVGAERRTARVRYFFAVDAAAEEQVKARASLVIAAPGGGPLALGRKPLLARARVGLVSEITTADVERLPRVHELSLAEARAAREGLPFSREELRLDRVSRGPSPRAIRPDHVPALVRFGRARIEALAARERLRAALLHAEDPRVSEAALAALAQLEPSDMPGRITLRDTVAGTIRGAELNLAYGNIALAQAQISTLRSSGIADAAELARILVLNGMLATARGLRSAAQVSFGQALCLNPAVSVRAPFEILDRALQVARQGNPCRGRRLYIEDGNALRMMVDGKPGLRVTAIVKNDPFQLVRRVRVERFGPGGGRAQDITVDLNESREVAATFQGDKEALHAPSRAGFRITAYDQSGVIVARRGQPNLLILDVEDGDGVGGFSVPDWVLVAAGGLVVAGLVVGGVFLLADDGEVERGIGPVTVDF